MPWGHFLRRRVEAGDLSGTGCITPCLSSGDPASFLSDARWNWHSLPFEKSLQEWGVINPHITSAHISRPMVSCEFLGIRVHFSVSHLTVNIPTSSWGHKHHLPNCLHENSLLGFGLSRVRVGGCTPLWCSQVNLDVESSTYVRGQIWRARKRGKTPCDGHRKLHTWLCSYF